MEHKCNQLLRVYLSVNKRVPAYFHLIIYHNMFSIMSLYLYYAYPFLYVWALLTIITMNIHCILI